MPRTGPLRRKRKPEGNSAVRFEFDGRTHVGLADERVLTSLICEDQLATSRSAKYRRARGAFCLRGDCGTCLVRIDGRPNRRACMERLHEGSRIESQNKIQPDAFDPTRLVDLSFRSGIDHHHLMVKPRIANQAMQTIARQLTGLGTLPDGDADAAYGAVHREVEVLVIGAGPAGRAATKALRDAGLQTLNIDRDPPPDADELVEALGVFGAYPLEGWWAATAPTEPALHTLRARNVLLALGSRDTMLPFPDNDRPGVVAARGLAALLERDQLELEAHSVVVVGDDDFAGEMARRLESRLVASSDVKGIVGSDRVRGIETKTGRIDCRFVAVAAPPAPAHELAVMSGARTHFDGSGFAVVRDDEGRCGELHDAQVWAAGDLCGYVGPHAAADDGLRVARAIIESYGGEIPTPPESPAATDSRGDRS